MGDGLEMLRNLDFSVNITSFNNRLIDAEVQTEKITSMRWTGVYSHAKMGIRKKKRTWTLLQQLAGLLSKHRLCFGDFNEILHSYEKIGGDERRYEMITVFKEAVLDYNLVALGYKRYLFTWAICRFGPYFVEEKLDRFLCNKYW